MMRRAAGCDFVCFVEIGRTHRLRPASGRDAGRGTLEARAPVFLRASGRAKVAVP